MNYNPSKGRIDDSSSDVCIVSWPVTLGEKYWHLMTQDNLEGNTPVNHALIWSGNDNEEEAVWFGMFKENILKALKKGQMLLVVGHEDYENYGGRQLQHDPGRGYPVEYRIGRGQVTEIEWLHSQSVEYSVWTIATADAIIGGGNDVIAATRGDVTLPSKTCVVSFPASLGVIPTL